MDSYTNIEGIKAIMHNSDIYYLISVGLDGKFNYVNTRYAANFSFIDDNLLGKPYDVTMHPDDTGICKEVGARCFEQPDKSFSAIIRKHNGKGGYVVTLWDYRLIQKDGIPEGIFCIGHDITELEAKKNDVKILSESLDKSHQILEKVAYEQSHMVRAPVANILGLIGILKSMDLDSNLSSIVSMLEESSLRLDDIIKETVKSTYK
jgi:PAS domain S-box-containing protein